MKVDSEATHGRTVSIGLCKEPLVMIGVHGQVSSWYHVADRDCHEVASEMPPKDYVGCPETVLLSIPATSAPRGVRWGF